MSNLDKKTINFNDLVSGAKHIDLEKSIADQYLKNKDNKLSDDNSFISNNQESPEVLKEIFFNQTHEGKNLEIDGLDKRKEIAEIMQTDMHPITKIFNLAREMLIKSKRSTVKDNFYAKEEIQVKNDLTISKGLFSGTILTFLFFATMFAIFKNRLIMIASALTMAGVIFAGMLFYVKKEHMIKFNTKKFKIVNEDIHEIKIRLKRIKEDISYFPAIRAAEKIPNFEIEFNTKVDHIIDLLNEYEHIEDLDFNKKEIYYQEIIKTFEDMANYEKTTYDKYYHDKLKKY